MDARKAAAIATAAITVGGSILIPAAAFAQPAAQTHTQSHSQAATPTYASFAQGQFLTGTLLGTDLDAVLAIQAAQAANTGSQPNQVDRDPLSVDVLNTIQVNSPGIQTSVGDIVDAGVLEQYARAERNGVSYAASGAIANDGAIGVGTQSGPGGTASIDLDSLLGNRIGGGIADLRLDLAGIAAQAHAQLNQYTGDYTLADARLNLTVPALANLSGAAQTALDPVNDAVNGLNGPDGALAAAIRAQLGGVAPALVDANVSATVSADLDGAVARVLPLTLSDQAITIDTATGTVSINLAALPNGPGLNDQAPGTEVISDAVVNNIVDGILRLVANYADDATTSANDALLNAAVSVRADINTQTSVQTGETLVGGVLGLLGQIIGGTVQPVYGLVDTGASVAIDGTLGGLENGSAANATVTARVLGQDVNVDAGLFVGALGNQLDGIGIGSLRGAVLDPIASIVGGSDGIGALDDLVSVQLNTQDVSGPATASRFTESAVTVSLLDGSLATLSLGNATVGPNTTAGTGGNPGDPTDPTDPTNPGGNGGGGNGGNHGGNTTNASSVNGSDGLFGSLAHTGWGLAGLILLIGGLLAGVGALLKKRGMFHRNSEV